MRAAITPFITSCTHSISSSSTIFIAVYNWNIIVKRYIYMVNQSKISVCRKTSYIPSSKLSSVAVSVDSSTLRLRLV